MSRVTKFQFRSVSAVRIHARLLCRPKERWINLGILWITCQLGDAAYVIDAPGIENQTIRQNHRESASTERAHATTARALNWRGFLIEGYPNVWPRRSRRQSAHPRTRFPVPGPRWPDE